MTQPKQTKMLHELIALANAGKQFRASRDYQPFLYDGYFRGRNTWKQDAVMADWEYEEIREPLVVEFELDCQSMNLEAIFDQSSIEAFRKDLRKLNAKKWKIVATEVIGE